MSTDDHNSLKSSEAGSSLIRIGIDKLSALDRQIVILHFGAGLTVEDIGEAVEIPGQTVAYRVMRAAERLRIAEPSRSNDKTVDACRITDAICSGFRAPSGLYRNIESRLCGAAHCSPSVTGIQTSSILRLPRVILSMCRSMLCGRRTALSQSE